MPFPSQPHKYFTEKWQQNLSPVFEQTHNCVITASVLNRGAKGTFDPATGKTVYTGDVTTVLYEGGARVQPRGSSLDRTNNATDTAVRRAQFQLPIGADTLDNQIRPGTRITVTECDLYPTMMTFDYRVQGVLNSGNPLEVTIIAVVDEETVIK